jgi:hypothetical protein
MPLFIPLHAVLEIVLHSTQPYASPYNEVDVTVAIQGPDGATVSIPAFWAGENIWKFRFSGPVVGDYTYVTTCTNPADSGLDKQIGSITVQEASSTNPLRVHGRLRVASGQRHFEHEDGTPFLWIGDTWWMGLTTRLDWPQGFKVLTADRVAKGFSVIQIIAGPLPDMDAWDPRGKNEAGYPFKEGFAEVNPAYFDQADLKIGHLAESGLVPCIVGMWGYYLPQIGVDKIKRFWRYLVARYGAYPVMWCAAGEGTMPYYLSETKEADAALQKKGWTEIMRYLREVDGYHNPIGIHPTRRGREMVEDTSVMDFEMLQTGHGDIESIENVRNTVKESYEDDPRMPVVNSEINYEGIMGYCWQNIQRWCFYVTMLNGAAGHTYGANGIWQMSTPEQPYGLSPHGHSWGNTPWKEAYQLPGSRQIGLGANLLRRYAWWQMEPHPEWIEPAGRSDSWRSACAGIPGKLRIVYISHLWDPPLIKGLESPSQYAAYYFDPVTGKEIPAGSVTPDTDGNWRPPVPPEVHDWVLVLDTRKQG